MRLHRAQLEYELREKTILLAAAFADVAGIAEAEVGAVAGVNLDIRNSVSSCAHCDRRRGREIETRCGGATAAKLKIDASIFAELLDIREGKKDRKAVRVDEAFARYSKLVEQVTGAVDKMLDPAA